jgi:hypothetical protein
LRVLMVRLEYNLLQTYNNINNNIIILLLFKSLKV